MDESSPTRDQAPPPGPGETGPAERALASALRTVFGVLRVVMVIVLAALVFSNTRFLQQNQRAVILRFGKIVGTGAGRVHGPGVVFAWPQPIDEIIVVDKERVQTLEIDDFMYRKGARAGGTESLGDTLTPGLDGYTLTGDANIVHTSWGIQYQVDDVVEYALNVEDPAELIRRALAAAVVHTSAELTVEEVLWGEGEEMRRRVRRRLQERLDAAASGIAIGEVNTTAREHPRQTDEGFVAVTNASLERSKEKQKAERYREAVLAAVAGAAGPRLAVKVGELAAAENALEDQRGALEDQRGALEDQRGALEDERGALEDQRAIENEPDTAKVDALRAEVAALLDEAGGEVAWILGEAKKYKTKVVEDAASMAATFEALDRKYKENPEVFIRQTYLDAMEKVVGQAGATFVLSRGERIWLLLEPEKKPPPKKEEAAPVGAPTPEERMRRGLMNL